MDPRYDQGGGGGGGLGGPGGGPIGGNGGGPNDGGGGGGGAANDRGGSGGPGPPGGPGGGPSVDRGGGQRQEQEGPSSDADRLRDIASLRILCESATEDDPASWDAIRNWLRSHGADVARQGAERLGEFNTTPLHLACRNHPPVDVVDVLLSAAPDTVRWEDRFGWLPLHYACANGASDDVLRILAEAFPDSRTATDRRGRSPLHFALGNTARPATPAAVVLLASTGASSCADENGMLPLHYACAYGASEEALRVLTDGNVDSITATDRKGRTPLHFALGNADRPASPAVVRLLLSRNREVVNAVDEEGGQLPLHLLATRANALNEGQKAERDNVDECLMLYLGAEPKPTADFLTALQALPEWLADRARSATVVMPLYASASRPLFARRKLDRLLKKIAANNSKLGVVDLNGKNIGDEDVKRLAEALRGNTVVTHLHLEWNIIGVVGATALAAMLKHNSSIIKLHLGYNSIGDYGATALADMIKVNSSVIMIRLSANHIGDVGAKALAEALKVNSFITHLDLANNSMSDEGVRALAEALEVNSSITVLRLGDLDNHNIRVELLEKVVCLVEINDKSSSPEEARRCKDAEFGSGSEFYAKLVEDDDRNINLKISELVPFIKDAHDAVLFYTLVNFSYNSGGITSEDRSRYVATGLRVASATTACTESVALFKLLLRKASEDGALVDMEREMLDREAEVTHTSHAPFVRELRERIRSNAARIDGLEANVEALGQSLEKLKAGIRRQWRVQSAVGLVGAVLNAVSFGVAGSALSASVNATIGSIVDFGDVTHIRAVVANVGDASVKEAFEAGLSLAEDEFAEQKLLQAASSGENPVVTIAFAAKVIEGGNQRRANGDCNSQAFPATHAAAPQPQPIYLDLSGKTVVLKGLVSAPDLNGRMAVISSFEKETGRFIVSLGGSDGRMISVNQSNFYAPLATRLQALEEELQPGEFAPSVPGRVLILEKLLFGTAQEGSLLERIAHLEQELGM